LQEPFNLSPQKEVTGKKPTINNIKNRNMSRVVIKWAMKLIDFINPKMEGGAK